MCVFLFVPYLTYIFSRVLRKRCIWTNLPYDSLLLWHSQHWNKRPIQQQHYQRLNLQLCPLRARQISQVLRYATTFLPYLCFWVCYIFSHDAFWYTQPTLNPTTALPTVVPSKSPTNKPSADVRHDISFFYLCFWVCYISLYVYIFLMTRFGIHSPRSIRQQILRCRLRRAQLISPPPR